MKRLWLCLPALLLAASVQAQVPVAPAAGTNVEVDPIRCWWRTGAGAVRIGEIFDLSLTCAVLENDTVKVIPDESHLGVSVIALAPFEVVGGSHPTDLHSGARRFFQYQYKLRIIGPDAIGKDAGLPPLAIHYTINNLVTNNSSVKGRELVYILPSDPIRVSSMVPSEAADIRDATGEDFSNVETFEFRASTLNVIAMTCVGLGVLVALLVVVGLVRRSGSRAPVGDRLLDTRSLIGEAANELNAVAREREQQGWSEALAARALAATRLAATCAIGATASQRIAGADASAGEGRLISAGGFRDKARVLSGSTTPINITQRLSSASADAVRTPMLESLRDALTTFGASQYGREPLLDQAALDRALAATQTAATQLRSEHSWLKTMFRQWRAGGGTPVASRA